MDDRQQLRDLALNDKGFVFDPLTGATFSTNPTGLQILRFLQEGADRSAILAGLQARFDVRGDDLTRDLDEFVSTLRRQGLVGQDFGL
ncbi:MAG: HPr-rel-A system PqqD family peptide chaperone [Alphaproteobacteria bacterium]|nr:HPr-rel-A system PqqD family peptide chaperone [Alphaproteobacteria bacterium]